jgi:hypothetical protein
MDRNYQCAGASKVGPVEYLQDNLIRQAFDEQEHANVRQQLATVESEFTRHVVTGVHCVGIDGATSCALRVMCTYLVPSPRSRKAIEWVANTACASRSASVRQSQFAAWR